MREIGPSEKLFLGEIFESVEGTVPKVGGSSSGMGWASIDFRMASVVGIPSFQSTITAPFEDRPVLQQTFDLCLEEGLHPQSLEKRYLSRINRVFGEPISTTEYATNKWHEVRFSSKWTKDDFKISLSVYGSARKERDGLATGELFFDLQDEIVIAEPYLEHRRQMEESLWGGLGDLQVVSIVQTTHRNYPFFRYDYEKGHTPMQGVPDDLRRSQKALFRRELLETPTEITDQFSANEIIIWTAGGNHFLSCGQDAILLKSGVTNVDFHRIEPARGPGGTRIVVGELTVNDDRNSEALMRLKGFLEKILGQKAGMHQYYND